MFQDYLHVEMRCDATASQLMDILHCGVRSDCGAEGWEDIEEYGMARKWFADSLDLRMAWA